MEPPARQRPDQADAVGEVVWEVSIDSTVVRAHQHAAGARRKGATASRRRRPTRGRRGLGRSRGGLTTKLHLACDGKGGRLAVDLTPGQRHESTQLEAVLDAIRVPRPGGRGRPRKRPDQLIANKGYSYARCRAALRRRGIPHASPA